MFFFFFFSFFLFLAHGGVGGWWCLIWVFAIFCVVRNVVELQGNSDYHLLYSTVQILCIGTDRSQQTVQTKIRLLLKKQSDQGLRCLPFQQHLLDALMQCYIKLFYF